MKNIIGWTAFVLMLYVLQSSLLPLLAYRGISVDILLLLVVSYSFLRGHKQGVFMGFMAGLLQDLATGTFFGVNIFAKMAIGYGCGYFSRRLFEEQLMLPLMAVATSTVVHYLITLVFFLLLGYMVDLFQHWQLFLLPMLLYNMVFALPVHVSVAKICTLLKEKK